MGPRLVPLPGSRRIRRLRQAALLFAVGAGCLTAVSTADAQSRISAVVTHVVDGDSVDVRLPDGRGGRVRLIGIEAPKSSGPVECGGDGARSHLEGLVEGRDVVLVTDPSQGSFDETPEFLAYVDRTDGLDVGESM